MVMTGYASLFFVLVLTTFARCGLGGSGSTHVHNGATRDIIHWKYLTHNDGNMTLISHTTLAQGATEVFEVPSDVKCITTS